jgi:hypothetical protein
MATQLDIDIAGESFQLKLKYPDRRLLRAAAQWFGSYKSPSTNRACRVTIFAYSGKRFYAWNPAEIDRLEQRLQNIHRRAPSSKQDTDRVSLALDILRRYDPESPLMENVRSWYDANPKPMHAVAGADLFLYDKRSHSAYFFLKKRFRRAHMLVGVINGVMFVLSNLLMCSGGLLVHGSAVERNSLGILFLGASGAGKTTVARLCRPDICFSDDGVVVKNEGGRFYAYRSPFRQIEEFNHNTGIEKGEIKKIFLLEKGAARRVLPLKRNELMGMLLTHLTHFFKYLDREAAEKGFYAIKDMLDQLPAYRLQFEKSEDIWNRLVES